MNVVQTLILVSMVFFQEKSLNFFRLNFTFGYLTFGFFFSFSSFPLLANSNIEQLKC